MVRLKWNHAHPNYKKGGRMRLPPLKPIIRLFTSRLGEVARRLLRPLVTLEEAKSILGDPYVIDAATAASVWNMEVPHDLPIPFTKKRLMRCAKANAKGDKWRLVCCLGISVLDMHTKRPEDFYHSSIWQQHERPQWMSEHDAPCYMLINMKLRLRDAGREQMMRYLMNRKRVYAWAHFPTVVETIVTLTHSQRETCLTDGMHVDLTEGDTIPTVQVFDDGVNISTTNKDVVAMGINTMGIVLCIIPESLS
ncbi:MAG: hypothetical protein V4519_01835 [Patescibacteria group bacterium]